MKKFAKFVSFVMCIALLCASMSIGAYAFYEPNIDDLVVTGVVDGGLTHVSSISSRNMSRIQNINSKSDEEKAMELLNSIGFECDIDSPAVADIAKRIDKIKSVKSQQQIIEMSDSGTQRIITEEEYTEIEKKSSNSSSNVARTAHQGSSTSSNGYMQQTIMAFYLGDPEGLYRILGGCVWLKEPLVRQVDAVSLGAADSIFVWENNKDADFYGAQTYVQTYSSGTTFSKTDIIDEAKNPPEIAEENGFFYTWRLPVNDAGIDASTSIIYSEFQYLIAGNCRVQDYDDHTQMLSIKIRYAHAQLTPTFDISYSISPSEDVFAITGFFPSINVKNYYARLSWDYASEF